MFHSSFTIRIVFIVFSFPFLFIAGCGKKGPPLPLEFIVPEPVRALKVEGRGDGFLISWKVPTKNSDGTNLADLGGFKLYKRKESKDCPTCPHDFPLYLDVDPEIRDGIAVKEGRVFLLDVDVQSEIKYLYKIAAYNKSGYSGDFSEVVSAQWTVPPPSVATIQAMAGDKSVVLEWEPVGIDDDDVSLIGYRVYRTSKAGDYPSNAIKTLDAHQARFTDIGLENNVQYYYVITGLVKAGETLVEGPTSAEVLVVPLDMVSPSVPEGLRAVSMEEGVALSWNTVDEEDLAGYFIYRKKAGELAMERLNSEPVLKNNFIDNAVINGAEYVYSVTSVDNSPQGNESRPSNEVSAVARSGP